VFVPFANVLAIAAAAVKMPVSPDPATLATIFHQLFDLGMPAKEIAQRHGITDRAVRRYRQCWQCWQLFGTPRAPRGGVKIGRQRSCTYEQEQALIEWLGTNTAACLDDMAVFLFDLDGIRVSTSTVCRILHRRGWSRKAAAELAGQRSEST
jgi:transposase